MRRQNSPHFMETASSLPSSHELSNCPHPKPDESSPSLPSYIFRINISIILPSSRNSSTWFHSIRLYNQNSLPISTLIRATWSTHLILLQFVTVIISGEKHRSWTSSLHPVLQQSVPVLPFTWVTKFHVRMKQKVKLWLCVLILTFSFF